jgi:hypothetical protein
MMKRYKIIGAPAGTVPTLEMLHLLNGKGQLGSALSVVSDQIDEDVYVYHTWNVANKSKAEQKEEYHKFKIYIENNRDKKIVFISTKSQKDTWYTHYKQMSEALLLTKCEKGVVIRLPTFIGKPSRVFLAQDDVKTYGNMELISLEVAANKIVEICGKKTKLKIVEVEGETVSAYLVREIVKATK